MPYIIRFLGGDVYGAYGTEGVWRLTNSFMGMPFLIC